jgi:GR25 family glycosyltransferase involved in LPS biosynthesis
MLTKENSFVINLDRRPDRLEAVTKEFQRVNLEFTRIAGIDGRSDPRFAHLPTNRQKGMQATFFTQRVAWAQAKEKNLPFIALFEDDVVFSDYFPIEFDLFMREVPKDWEVIHLGAYCNPDRILPYSPSVRTITETWGLHGYMIKNSMYDPLLAMKKEDEMYPIDQYLFKEFFPSIKKKAFTPWRRLCYQDGRLCDNGDEYAQSIFRRDLYAEVKHIQ